MMVTAKRSAPASLTVSEMPSTAIEPLTASIGASVGRHRDLEPVAVAVGLDRRDLAHRVDVAEHQMAAQLVAQPQRPLEVDRAARPPAAERGARQRLRGGLHRVASPRPSRRR